MLHRLTSVVLMGLLAIGAAGAARTAERDIYPAPEQAPADLAAALKLAAASIGA